MGIFKDTSRIMFKNVRLFLIISVFTLILAIININFTPLLPMIAFLNTLGGNIMGSLVNMIQLAAGALSSPQNIIIAIAALVLCISLLSVIIALVFSGFMFVLYKKINGIKGEKGDFRSGIKHYYRKYLKSTVISLFLFFIFVIFSLISVIPALVISQWAFSTRNDLIPIAILVLALTFIVIFFLWMFFRIYVFFWYPSLIENTKKAFSKGKRVADGIFWKVVGRIFVFDIIFALYEMLFTVARWNIILFEKDGILKFVLFFIDWVFATIFIGLFIGMITNFYNKYKMLRY